ncbi:flagellar hook-basal body protein [Undibacterium sp. TJN19]|uniref:flagellar hook-basal body protein n=1 Tax=Undibacterium sp. TJN19 TaxID=3413055 RepID=UPI003BEF987B
MANALISAVQSMQNDLQYLDTISQNMVNVATTGYKRAVPTSKPLVSLFDDVMKGTEQAGDVSQSQQKSGVLGSVLDLSTGPIKQTGKPWDMAIASDGYFELMTPDGLGYTRAGDFHVDGSGRLVSSQGYAVQGLGGDIQVRGSDITVDHTGRILQGDHQIAQLKIVRFAEPKKMVKTINGLLQPASAENQAMESQPEIQVGFLENSNVTPMREMVAMMETTRHFESAQKLFQGYDEMLNTAIQKLGEF